MCRYPSTWDFDKLEDREPFLPERHIFYAQRAIEVEDGKDKWEGMADDSKKMDEEHHHGQRGTAGSGNKVSRRFASVTSRARAESLYYIFQ